MRALLAAALDDDLSGAAQMKSICDGVSRCTELRYVLELQLAAAL